MNDIEKLFEEYSDCIYRFCCNIADNLYEAEDLFQDTFLKAMEIEAKVMAAENKKSYLIGIAIKLEKTIGGKRPDTRKLRQKPEGLIEKAISWKRLLWTKKV